MYIVDAQIWFDKSIKIDLSRFRKNTPQIYLNLCKSDNHQKLFFLVHINKPSKNKRKTEILWNITIVCRGIERN